MAIKILYFASLREQLGCSEQNVAFQPGLKVSDVWGLANQNAMLPRHCVVSVNQEYANLDSIVEDRDEIAFFPTRYGRLMAVKICQTAFDPWLELQSYQETDLAGSNFGATAVFVGTMRDFNDHDAVTGMALEHYPGMTEKQLAHIIDEAKQQWPVLDALVVHRVGELLPQQPIVLVVVWSHHRGNAFDACRYIIEALKTTAPFWKKETLTNGQIRWVTKNTDGYNQNPA